MPVDAVGAGSRPIVDNYTIGANAKAKEEAKTLATTKEMSDAEKQALFLKKMNLDHDKHGTDDSDDRGLQEVF